MLTSRVLHLHTGYRHFKHHVVARFVTVGGVAVALLGEANNGCTQLFELIDLFKQTETWSRVDTGRAL